MLRMCLPSAVWFLARGHILRPTAHCAGRTPRAGLEHRPSLLTTTGTAPEQMPFSCFSLRGEGSLRVFLAVAATQCRTLEERRLARKGFRRTGERDAEDKRQVWGRGRVSMEAQPVSGDFGSPAQVKGLGSSWGCGRHRVVSSSSSSPFLCMCAGETLGSALATTGSPFSWTGESSGCCDTPERVLYTFWQQDLPIEQTRQQSGREGSGGPKCEDCLH